MTEWITQSEIPLSSLPFGIQYPSIPNLMSKPSNLRKFLVYESSRWLTGFFCKIFFRYRAMGRENWPKGGGLVCSNHQSVMDPILAGLSYRGRLGYLARENLFDHWAFRWLIESLEAVPIKRDGLGIGGLKSALRRLKDDKKMLIFPEGTRTPDGEIQPFQPGFIAIARRGKAPVIPMAIAGAYEAWPKNRTFPRLSSIRVCIGEPLSAEEVADRTDDELMAELAERVAKCYETARASCAGKQLKNVV